MIRVLVSSCLLGEPVRYHGGDARASDEVLDRWLAEGRVVPVCPEVAGGLGVPRPPAEIAGAEIGGTGIGGVEIGGVEIGRADGSDVLEGRARVVTGEGEDVTSAFVRGAREALALARRAGARLAVLTDRSPSCGSTSIHDGSFSGRLVPGRGVTSALLEANGVRVFSSRATKDAARYLSRLEEELVAGRGAP